MFKCSCENDCFQYFPKSFVQVKEIVVKVLQDWQDLLPFYISDPTC